MSSFSPKQHLQMNMYLSISSAGYRKVKHPWLRTAWHLSTYWRQLASFKYWKDFKMFYLILWAKIIILLVMKAQDWIDFQTAGSLEWFVMKIAWSYHLISSNIFFYYYLHYRFKVYGQNFFVYLERHLFLFSSILNWSKVTVKTLLQKMSILNKCCSLFVKKILFFPEKYLVYLTVSNLN